LDHRSPGIRLTAADPLPPPKGTTVFVFLLSISLVAAGAIVGTVVTVGKDGYGRIPERKFVRSF
jgi:hypothetical protein